ncbi:hypothetical protein LY90DRAFT_639761 [Neocallimastix californiae]|uniref:Uncharacterized protein n=1 Tax=Neocallimastix californiae TaxID=1754190 RepID=A0A1Y2E9A3_9FUNG|nr:hypothetical protein LY90DRAFT_639761 [Neocallimastix californiae]|eukprot:ORY68151.1 hypothetical protein LY90DRAFT_639761 [Neocallimastix californiae]
MFHRLDAVKNEILDFCLVRKNKLDKIGVFSKQANIDRILTLFRTELRRKMDEEMWYLQTNNKLREERECFKEPKLSFEERFNNEIDDLNKHFEEMENPAENIEIHPIIQKINARNNNAMKINDESINLIKKTLMSDWEGEKTENKFKDNVREFLKKRKKMLSMESGSLSEVKEEGEKKNGNENENENKNDNENENENENKNENANENEKKNEKKNENENEDNEEKDNSSDRDIDLKIKNMEEKIKSFKYINRDLSKLSERQYEQNRELNKNFIDWSLDNINESMDILDELKENSYSYESFYSKLEKLTRKMENEFQYNMTIANILSERNIKNLSEEDLKDENIRKSIDRIKNLNATYQWEHLYNSDDDEFQNKDFREAIANNVLLQYKLYPFFSKKHLVTKPKKKHTYYLEKSRLNKKGDQPEFNYDEMDELEEHFKKLKETYDDEILKEFNFDTSTPMRIHGLRPSENEYMGIMDAQSSVDILCKFENPIDLERKKYLDEKLNTNHEAENLYKEITNYIFRNGTDIIDYGSDDNIVAAPNIYYEDENRNIFSNYVERSADYDDENKEFKEKKEVTPEVIEYKPAVKLLTRKSGKYHVKAETYFKNRANAMENTPSSKYELLKYNYGGYIPAYIVKKKKIRKNNRPSVNINEYKRYLANLNCDFLHKIINKDTDEQQKKSDADYYQSVLKKKLLKHDEETQMKHFKKKLKKYKVKFKEIAKTKEGFWNPEVLECIMKKSELIDKNENENENENENKEKEQKENKPFEEKDESKENVKPKNTNQSTNNENQTRGNNKLKKNFKSSSVPTSQTTKENEKYIFYSDVDEDEDEITFPSAPCNSYVNSDDELSDTISKYFTLNDDINKTHNVDNGIYMTLPTIQEAMECIFNRLRMPTNEKVDLAIKYGSYEFSMKFIQAITCWNIVSKLIIKREEKLERIREFESKVSNPYRFFKKDKTGSPAARFIEELYRKRFLNDLEPMNKQIVKLCIMIFKKYGDIVTYEGKNYIKKMKNDYSNIIKYSYKEFAKKQKRAPYTLKV